MVQRSRNMVQRSRNMVQRSRDNVQRSRDMVQRSRDMVQRPLDKRAKDFYKCDSLKQKSSVYIYFKNVIYFATKLSKLVNFKMR